MDICATKTYVVDHTAIADGSGLWGMEEGTVVDFNRAVVEINSYDEGKWHGYLSLYHDTDAHEHGLCYTDEGVTTSANTLVDTHPELHTLIYDASGSEQGMQEARMFNMDVSVRRPKSMSIEKLEELGYEVETY